LSRPPEAFFVQATRGRTRSASPRSSRAQVGPASAMSWRIRAIRRVWVSSMRRRLSAEAKRELHARARDQRRVSRSASSSAQRAAARS
jgi:hypothetical protein